MNVSVSICPTSLEYANGDTYDEAALLAAIREFILDRHPGATISCLQVGRRQGDAWAKLDGDSEAGEELMTDFFDRHGADEELFVADPEPVAVEVSATDETIRMCGCVEDYAGLEHTATQDACAAYRAAAVEALRRDPRARRLDDCLPRGPRMLHSQWAGAHWGYSSGAIGTMARDLTDDEKAAIDAADEAGRQAARAVIEQERAAALHDDAAE